VVLSRPEAIQACSSVEQAQLLCERFDRIFKRASTGYTMLDRLLRRLFRNKEGLLRVLERPEIPLNTNASENDIRAFVTKRKISGGTVSDMGRDARDIMLGSTNLHEVEVVVPEFIGARLGIPGPKSRPSQASSGQPCINSMALARKLALLPMSDSS